MHSGGNNDVATQRCNIVTTLFRIVSTLFQLTLQRCHALKSSLRIVPCNITLKRSIASKVFGKITLKPL